MLEHIGRYRVERMLGTGAFASVYMATDEALDATVAVKVLAENWSHDEDIRRRFSEEARILWRLDSDHIIRVHTVDQLPDGRPYFVMDYADAGTLADRMRDRRAGGGFYSVDDAMRISADIADGLAVAHRQGIVHRDLKPSNVLFRSSSGRAVRLVLADFGIARSLESARGSTIAAGTPHYMAPEQAQGQAERASDVYAAAVILHELLVGDPPFPFDSAGQVLRAQLTETPADVRVRRPDVPAPIAELISRGLALEPSHRPVDGDAWKAALAAASAGQATGPSQGATLGPGDLDRGGATLGPGDMPTPVTPTPVTPTPVYSPPAYTPPPAATPPPGPPQYAPPPSQPPQYPPNQPPTPPPAYPPAAEMSGPGRQSRKRQTPLIVGAILVVVAIVVAAVVLKGNKASAGEIILSPKDAPGANPFTPSVVPASASTPTFTPPTVPSQKNGATGSVSGAVPGLYGGTRQTGACDPGQLVAFLQANPAKASAWATTLGITTDQIASYVASLTPVVLRTDTRVTNHGFVNGTANPIPAVLQAGTAVLVDSYGVPRVKCYCGNPLTEPKPVASAPSYKGAQWPGFSPTQIIVIAPTIKIEKLVIIDVANGQPFTRPLGTSGAADTDAPPGLQLFGGAAQPGTATTSPTTPPTTPPTEPPGQPVSISREGSVSATSTYSGQFPVSAGVDGNPRTSWFSAGARDGNTTTYTWSGTRDDRITQVTIVGNAQNSDPNNRRGFGYRSVEIQIIDGNGNIVYDQGFQGPSDAVGEVNATMNVVGRRVVLKLSGRESPDCGGFGELNIVASR